MKGRSPFCDGGSEWAVLNLFFFFRVDSRFYGDGAPRTNLFIARDRFVVPDSMERVKIGEVFHYFGKIGVAAIRLTDGALAVGDTIQVQGPTTNLTQVVEGMQIEHGGVARAEKGQEVGVKLNERARERDLVYKVLPG